MIKTLLCCAPTFKKLGGLHQKMLSCVNGVTSLDFWGFLPTSQATLQQPHLEWDVTAVRNPACGPHLWTNQCTEPLYVTAIVTNTHTHTHLVEESYHTRLKTWGAWPCVYWSWWVAWHPESYAVNMGCGHFAVCGDACLSQWCVGLKPSNLADDNRLTSFRDTPRLVFTVFHLLYYEMEGKIGIYGYVVSIRHSRHKSLNAKLCQKKTCFVNAMVG